MHLNVLSIVNAMWPLLLAEPRILSDYVFVGVLYHIQFQSDHFRVLINVAAFTT